VLDCIKIDYSEEEEQMLVEEAPKEDEPESRDVEVFNLFQDVNKANVCQVTQVPVFFRIKFTAKTKLSLVGFELLSRSFPATKWGKGYYI
jgi:hypothetical protein